ncbi:MAG: recombinase family protein [Alkaliphilus sp.]
MARTSRKKIKKNEDEENRASKLLVYNTALYVRLSMDSEKKKDNSIENQRNIMLDFIAEKPDFVFHRIYCDDGFSGTNFERPAFKEMMECVQKGKINCVIVKDLSRFGRNYLETGRYIEQILPSMNIRFIAINDNYDNMDTEKNEGFSLALKNLINSVYSKDISKKVKSQIEVQQKKGNYIGTYPPYGYLKDVDVKYRLVIDEAFVETVKSIFKWRAEGKSAIQIARELNETGISTQRKNLIELEITKNEKYINTLWTDSTVMKMLKNRVYLGHMEQGKSKSIACGSRKTKRVDEEEWHVVKNTHEAIITQELFDKVQNVNFKRSIKPKQNVDAVYPEKIFTGLVRCGHCGFKVRTTKIKTKLSSYSNRLECATRHKKMKSACVPNSITEKDLLSIISDELKKTKNCY